MPSSQNVSSMTESLMNVLDCSDSPRKDKFNDCSPVYVLDPVYCRPPSGFSDSEMSESVVNILEVYGFFNCEITSSI